MAEIEDTASLQGNIRWHHYNYPPLLKLVHFVPSEINKNKKFIVMALFIVHLVILGSTLINFICACFQGGLRVLYAFLLLLFINPPALLIFERGTPIFI